MFGIFMTAVPVGALSLILIRKLSLRTREGEPIQTPEKPYHHGVIIGSLIFLLMALGALFSSRKIWLLISLVNNLALLLFFVFPEHLMGYHARYLGPVAPILFALAGAGFARLESRLAARASRPMVVAASVALAVVCAFAVLSRAPAIIADRRFYAEGYDRAHRALATRLARLPAGRIALSDAGIIPYRTDWPTLDLVGLNDRHIARTGDRTIETVFAFRPDVLVLASQDTARFIPFGWNRWEAPLLDAAVARGFQFAARYRFHDRYWLWTLADPGSTTGRALLSAPPGR